MKSNKGITLVALVITIIILLILAGVTIASLNESGLFGKSKEAVNEYQVKADEENERLNTYEVELDKHLPNKTDASEVQEDEEP